MNIKKMRQATNFNQKEFAEYFNIPVRTIQDWEQGRRTPPEYVVELIEYKLKKERKIKMLNFGEFKLRDTEDYEVFYVATDTLHVLVTTNYHELKDYRPIGPVGKIKVYHDGLYFGTPDEMYQWIAEEVIDHLKEKGHLIEDGETIYGETIWKLI